MNYCILDHAFLRTTDSRILDDTQASGSGGGRNDRLRLYVGKDFRNTTDYPIYDRDL